MMIMILYELLSFLIIGLVAQLVEHVPEEYGVSVFKSSQSIKYLINNFLNLTEVSSIGRAEVSKQLVTGSSPCFPFIIYKVFRGILFV